MRFSLCGFVPLCELIRFRPKAGVYRIQRTSGEGEPDTLGRSGMDGLLETARLTGIRGLNEGSRRGANHLPGGTRKALNALVPAEGRIQKSTDGSFSLSASGVVPLPTASRRVRRLGMPFP